MMKSNIKKIIFGNSICLTCIVIFSINVSGKESAGTGNTQGQTFEVNLTPYAIIGTAPAVRYSRPVRLEGGNFDSPVWRDGKKCVKPETGEEDVHTAFPVLERTDGPAWYTIRFEKPMKLTRFMFQAERNPDEIKYEIFGDTDGNENYDQLIPLTKNASGKAERASDNGHEQDAAHAEMYGTENAIGEVQSDKWITVDLGNRELYGIRIKFSNVPPRGYRKASPVISWKIYGEVDFQQYLDLQKGIRKKPLPSAPALGRGKEEKNFLKSHGVPRDKIPFKDRILKSAIVIGYSVEYKNEVPLDKNKTWLETEDILLRMGVDNIWFEAHRMGSKDKDIYHSVLFPSKVAKCAENENAYFEKLAARLKKNNISMVSWLYGRVPGITTGHGQYPPPEAGEINACTLCGPWFGPRWAQMLSEAVEAGAAGACVAPDEYQYYNEHVLNNKIVPMAEIPKNDPCRPRFREEYGLEIPTSRQDTEEYRKWILFTYNRIGGLYKTWTAAVDKACEKKGIEPITTSVLINNNDSYNSQIHSSNAWDIIGAKSGIAYLTSDVYRPYPVMRRVVKLLWGAHPARKPMILPHSGSDSRMIRQQRDNFTETIVPILSGVFNGMRGVVYYRSDYTDRSGMVDLVGKTNRILTWLDRLSFHKAKVPDKVAVLHSRAGEDWWQLKVQTADSSNPRNSRKMANANLKYPPGSDIDGYVIQKYVEDGLLTRGVPYDLYFLDQVKDVAAACEKYDVLVVPFPYSISEAAFQSIKKAAEAGKKIIIARQKGETNEFGTNWPTPKLEALIQNQPKNVAFYPAGDSLWLGDAGHMRNFLDSVAREIKSTLGSGFPLTVYGTDRHTEVSLLEKGEKEKFLLAVNTSGKRKEVVIGLNLPKGQYGVAFLALDGIYQGIHDSKYEDSSGRLNHDYVFNSDFFQNFALDLRGEDARIVYIYPVN